MNPPISPLQLHIPEQLPIHAQHQAIIRAIREHQVLVIAGETGSGKTTQLAKCCLMAGLQGQIAHSQPRRMAARSVATRIAEETGCSLGQGVGYRVRFHDRSRREDAICVMTDGILLNDIQRDRLLHRYAAIIIDEAHERSLNIDFLLGYLRSILAQRPELRVIITSATINTERFCAFFHDAPLIEVSGRCYPVDMLYRPWDEDSEQDLSSSILAAVDEAERTDPLGDVLVFLPGEREIRETHHYLQQHLSSKQHLNEIVPLYAKLSHQEQDRVFKSHAGRRIVLATNIAETSLTVPGIRFVIDSGLARISRYSPRHRVQRLPIERISQASAQQRAGRCGRLADGVCFRLYSEADFASRAAQTDPEIRRTHLASVLLRMADMRLGRLEDFPLMDAPDARAIRDGHLLLQELQALDDQDRLTAMGRKMARLPLDPRFSRMLLSAEKEQCLAAVLIIVSALSLPDPRLRPADEREKADNCHRQWMDTNSDFMTLLRLWRWYTEAQRHHSRSQLRKLCKKHYLSWMRMREWQDLQHQIAQSLSLPDSDTMHDFSCHSDAIHRSLLSGLLSQIGQRQEDGSYLGARGVRFAIMPGAAMQKKPSPWVMAAQWLELRQRYGVMLAAIDPAWLEQQGEHLLTRSYGEPYWSKRRGRVLAREQRSLFGLPLGFQAVAWHAHDAEASHRIFIREALLNEHLPLRSPVLRQLHTRIQGMHQQIEQHLGKSRRLYREDAWQHAAQWLDAHVSSKIYDLRTLERALKRDHQAIPLPRMEVIFPDGDIQANDFPDELLIGRQQLTIHYRFDPQHAHDGMSVELPTALLGQFPAERAEWLVPGLLYEKLQYYFKKLPPPQRRMLVPVPDFARACLAAMPFAQGDLHTALSHEVQRMAGLSVPPLQWRKLDLPKHLRMHFMVRQDDGQLIAHSDDLRSLQEAYASDAIATLASEQCAKDWAFGALPGVVSQQIKGRNVTLYPALRDDSEEVSLQYCDTEAAAKAMMKQGLLRLFALQLKQQIQWIEKKLPQRQSLLMQASLLQEETPLLRQLAMTCIEHLFMAEPWPNDQTLFEARLTQRRGELVSCAESLAEALLQALQVFSQIQQQLPAQSREKQQIGEQILRNLQPLLQPGFVLRMPYQQLLRYPAWFNSALHRLQQGARRFPRDQQDETSCRELYDAWQEHILRYPELAEQKAIQDFAYAIQELRVSLFSPAIRTSEVVSVSRLQKRWQKLRLSS